MGFGRAGWLHPGGDGGGASGDKIVKSIEMGLANVEDHSEGFLHFRGKSQGLPTYSTETTETTTYGAPASDATPDSTVGGDVTTQETGTTAPNPNAAADYTIGVTTSGTTTYTPPASDATPDSTVGGDAYPQPDITEAAESVIGTPTSSTTPDLTGTPEATYGSTWERVATQTLPLGNDLIDKVAFATNGTSISIAHSNGLTNYSAEFSGIAIGKWIVLRKDASNYVAGSITSFANQSNWGTFNGAFTTTGTVSAGDLLSFEVYAASGSTITPSTWTKTSAPINSNGLFNWASDFSNVQFHNNSDAGTAHRSDIENISSGKWVYIKKDASNYLYARLSSVYISNSQYLQLNPHGSWQLVGNIANDDSVEIHIYAATVQTFVAAVWDYRASGLAGDGEIDFSSNSFRVDFQDTTGTDFSTVLGAIAVGKWVYVKKDDSNYAYGRVTQNTPSGSYQQLFLGVTTVGTLSAGDDLYIEVYTGTETSAGDTFVAGTWDYTFAGSGVASVGDVLVLPDGVVSINHTAHGSTGFQTELEGIEINKWLFIRKDADTYYYGRITAKSAGTTAVTFTVDQGLTDVEGALTSGTLAADDAVYIEVRTGTPGTQEVTNFVTAYWNVASTSADAGNVVVNASAETFRFHNTDSDGTDRESVLQAIAVGKWVRLSDGLAGNHATGRVESIVDDGAFRTLINFYAGSLEVEGIDTDTGTVSVEVHTGTESTSDVTTVVETLPAAALVDASVAGNAHNLFSVVQGGTSAFDQIWELGGLTSTFTSDSLEVSLIGYFTAEIVARKVSGTDGSALSVNLTLQYRLGSGGWSTVGSTSVTADSYETVAASIDISGISEVVLTSGEAITFRLVLSNDPIRLFAKGAAFEMYYISKTSREISSEFTTELGVKSDGDIDWTSHVLSEGETGSVQFGAGASPSLINTEHDILTLIPPSAASPLPGWNDVGVYKVGLDPNAAGTMRITEQAAGTSVDLNNIDVTGLAVVGLVNSELGSASEVRIYKDLNNYMELTTSGGVTVSDFFGFIYAGASNITKVGTLSVGDTVRFQKRGSNVYYHEIGGVLLNAAVAAYRQVPTGLSVTFDGSGSVSGEIIELHARRNTGNWVRVQRWVDQGWTFGTGVSLPTFSADVTDLFVQGDRVEYRIFTTAAGVSGVSDVLFNWNYNVDLIGEVSKQIIDAAGALILCPGDFSELWSGQISSAQSGDTFLNAGSDFSEWKLLGFVWGHATSVQKTEVAPTQFWENDDNTKVYLADNVHMTVQRKSDTSFRVTFVTGTIILQQIIGLVKAGSD